MNLHDLHNIKDFAGIFVDPRFIALSSYMREHVGKSAFDGQSHAEAMIYRGAHKEGWLDSINEMPKLATPTRPDVGPKDTRLYSERP